MLNFPSETGFFVWFEEMDTVTLLPSGTSVVFISSSILTDVSLTVSLGNEVMTAVTILGIQCHVIYNVGSLRIDIRVLILLSLYYPVVMKNVKIAINLLIFP